MSVLPTPIRRIKVTDDDVTDAVWQNLASGQFCGERLFIQNSALVSFRFSLALKLRSSGSSPLDAKSDAKVSTRREASVRKSGS